MTELTQLQSQLQERFGDDLAASQIEHDELTIDVTPEKLRAVALALAHDDDFQFDTLIDVCGVDYLHHGLGEWQTQEATDAGFCRGVSEKADSQWQGARYAVVYHLLSTKLNHRVRMQVWVDGEPPMVDSVIDIWKAADWFEREAFDVMGIIFNGHPDLRRILTDYGFIGHPFRKDFPVSGHVEVRYDATAGRVIYEPIKLEPRVLVPKVVREDNRYLHPELEEEPNNG